MATRDDNHYIERTLAGETSAFAVLVDRHKDLVFTIAMNIARNREDAEEIAQDAFLKAFQKLATFRRDSRFSTWLYRIAYNESIGLMRKNRIPTADLGEEILENLGEEEMEQEVAGMDPAEQKKAVSVILNHLPEIDRVLVTLFYLDSQSVSEISSVTGLGESNVKVRLHRVRKRICSELYRMMKLNVSNTVK
jgi:RNA polymerase sigma-70 factor (ECF subfamily)